MYITIIKWDYGTSQTSTTVTCEHYSQHNAMPVSLSQQYSYWTIMHWQMIARLTRNVEVVGSSPIKGSRCFLEQETFHVLLSTSWFQERIRALFYNRTKINWEPYGRLIMSEYNVTSWTLSHHIISYICFGLVLTILKMWLFLKFKIMFHKDRNIF